MSRRNSRRDYPGAFFMLYEHYFGSTAYRDLKPTARALLTEFIRLCYPEERNGRLSISVKNAVKLLNVSKPTASKAFIELAEHGFLVLTKGEYWQERKAREWRITIKRFDGREPTNEWEQWQLGCPVVKIPKNTGSKNAPSLVNKCTQDWSKNIPKVINS